jgi:activator of 2-hydroxyglutaryl-CoA dehydratase
MWQLLLWIMTPLFLAASGALVWSKLHQLREHDEMLSSHAQRLGSLEGSRRAQEIQNAQHAEELRQQYAQFTAGVEAKIDTLVDAIDRGNQHTKDLLMQQWEVLTGVERKLDGHMEDETKRLISEAGQRIKQAERETELLAVLERLSTKLGIS